MHADALKDLIQNARLVVIAGIEGPTEEVVEVLREYVFQGGQLVIAAGGQFDPEFWNSVAWRGGAGVLPAPLRPAVVGKTPGEAVADLTWFSLNNANNALLTHHFFNLAGNSAEQLAALYAEPLFFKAVEADVSEELLDALVEAEANRLREQFAFLAEAETRQDQWAKLEAGGQLSESDRAARQENDQQYRQIRPQWLLFARDGSDIYDEQLSDVPAQRGQQLRTLAARTRFRVLAEFDNGLPFLVERSIGKGRVLLVTSGVLPEWNTLAKTYAMAVFDRVLRSMIQSTLPQHNFPAVESIEYPVGDDRDVHFALYRPGRELDAESVDAGFVGAEKRAVTIRNALSRGVYRLNAYLPENGNPGGEQQKLKWQAEFAVHGTPTESDLAPLRRKEFEDRQLGERLRWVGPGETISMAGSQIRGQNWWKYLVLAVIAILLVELVMLAWPVYRQKQEEAAIP
jgi:hypothetical protein